MKHAISTKSSANDRSHWELSIHYLFIEFGQSLNELEDIIKILYPEARKQMADLNVYTVKSLVNVKWLIQSLVS